MVLLIYGSLFQFFIFHTDLEKPQINDQRKGIFSSFCFLIAGMTVVLQTFIVEISPIASSIIQIIVFIGLGIYVILDQPYIMIFGNQVHTSSLFICAGGGITSLCMTGIKLISYIGHSNINAGFKLKGYFQVVGANIILYLLIITLTLLLGWIGFILSKKSAMKRWILSPVYEWYNFKNPSQIEKAARYIQLEQISSNANVKSFSLVLFNNALKRPQFQLSAELNVTTALFLQKFKFNQQRIINLLQRASQMHPGWTNRWIIFRMMRGFEEEEIKQIQQERFGLNALDIASQPDIGAYSMQIKLQLALNQLNLAKGHLLQTIQLIMRSNVDVVRASFNFDQAACNTLKAQRMFFSLLDEHPNNPTILRYIAELV
ncbi:MAG: hypothetical protein EZS28_011147 [Streblomastix strix]|uniref:Uncharacterized protein n=1 Tax=Streblomastix strix TaxID=222440 RepID=A0A5J4WF07_9EUKA|nr:MAG: hypothetical protein EZS28_011147 [Streblomastix strix]